MPSSFVLRSNLRRSKALVGGAILTLALCAPALAETVLPVAPFRGVTLTNGGRVILRHGAVQKVTLVQGDAKPRTTIEDDDRLVIEGYCGDGEELVVEIRTPEIDEIRVSNGGVVESRGSFPRQAKLAAAVEDGGTLDARTLKADVVAAAVHDGGRILVMPQKTLSAAVAQGGGITYWGSPHVTSSIQHGGFVAKGKPADAARPLTELGHAHGPRIPPAPPVPPVPSTRGS